MSRRAAGAALFALLLDLVERLSEALHRQVGALAHGIDHARLLGNVLDPGPVVLGVHPELGGADLGGGVRIGLERIADDDRHLVLHLLGGTGGDEHVGRMPHAPLRSGPVWTARRGASAAAARRQFFAAVVAQMRPTPAIWQGSMRWQIS